MSDLSITAANVKKGAGNPQTTTLLASAGTTITAGQGMYQNTANTPPTWSLTNNTTSAATASLTAIALNGAQPGQPVTGLTSGQITIGATVTLGQIYVVSANAGGIAPVSDLGTGNYVTIIGVAISTTIINVGVNNTGIIHA